MIDAHSILTLAVREPIIETVSRRVVTTLEYCDVCKVWSAPGDHRECSLLLPSPSVVQEIGER